MICRNTSSQRGFSIIEALISLTIFLLVLTGAMVTYAPTRKIYKSGERRADMQQNARLAMAEMSRRIRLAGYFPENFSATPPSPLLADPVVLATDNALVVHGDVDSSDVSNAFMFCLDGTTLRRTRAPQTDSAAYNCAGGDVLAENATELSFTYYDASGNPIPDPPNGPYQLDNQSPGSVPDMSDTSQRAAVRRVVIRLTTEQPVPGKDEMHVFTITSDVGLRNAG